MLSWASSGLPTSSSRASTAAVTKISHHDSPTLKAEIYFLSEKEWREDIALAQNDIVQRLEDTDVDVDREPADAALVKLQAVRDQYMFRFIHSQLSRENPDSLVDEIREILGSSVVFEGDPESEDFDFVQKLNQYVATSESPLSQERQLWPLVTSSQIWVKSDVLSQGLTFVDLPGTGDSNPALMLTRHFSNRVAKAYGSNADALWIVANVKRMVDDKARAICTAISGTRDWLKLITRELFADGRAESGVTIIATHIDVGDPPSSREHLNPRQDSKSRQMCLEILKREQSSINDAIFQRATGTSARKRVNSDAYAGDNPPKAKKRRGDIEPQVLPTAASQHTGNSAPSSLWGQKPINELLAEAKTLGGKISKIMQDMERAEQERSHTLVMIKNARNTYVESRLLAEIAKLVQVGKSVITLTVQQNISDIHTARVFTIVEDTGIPALRHIAVIQTNRFQSGPVILLIKQFYSLLSEILVYLQQKPALGNACHALRNAVFSEFGTLQTEMEAEVQKAHEVFKVEITTFRKKFQDALDNAENLAGDTIQEITEPIKSWNTYRAAMRRCGEWGAIDFNRDLVGPVTQGRTAFKSTFTHNIPRMSEHSYKEVDNSEPSVKPAVEMVSAAAKATVQCVVDRRSAVTKANSQEAGRKLVSSFPSTIRDTMSNHYSVVAQEKGRGMKARMKTANMNYVVTDSHIIYGSLTGNVDRCCDSLWDQTYAHKHRDTGVVEEMLETVRRAFTVLYTEVPELTEKEIDKRNCLMSFLNKTRADVEAMMLENSEDSSDIGDEESDGCHSV
ncbi:hypothetical protein K439DRAFT_1617781 [Ramaria rubella]|nr:hypothetical protein K439DRAFT_1617781 [Ramaria rubella]